MENIVDILFEEYSERHMKAGDKDEQVLEDFYQRMQEGKADPDKLSEVHAYALRIGFEAGLKAGVKLMKEIDS